MKVEEKELNLRGDMRSIQVSFEKGRQMLQFNTLVTLEDGVDESCCASKTGVVGEPQSERYRTHPVIILWRIEV